MTKNFYYEEQRPVVETISGAVRGYTFGNTSIFLGVPYGKAKRYKMPEASDPWTGVRDTMVYGDYPMQFTRPGKGMALYGIQRFWPESEDCLNLNIWAPKIDGKKRPVFVWMHGGGFCNGASIETDSYNLFNMSVYGDIVAISVNARLGILGFLNLEEYGNEFSNSMNLGIADLSFALKWIHENISAFGGDPGNVTICGQSGGGGKVRAMMGIEENKGLFHKAIIMSGCMKTDCDYKKYGAHSQRELEARITKVMLDSLHITKENIETIYTLPYETLLAAYKSAEKQIMNGDHFFIGPVSNEYFRGNELENGYCDWAKDIPKMYTSVIAEFATFGSNMSSDIKTTMTEHEQMEIIQKRFGNATDDVLEAFRRAYPQHPEVDVLFVDTDTRTATLETALMAAQNGKNNTYVACLAYDFPINGGVPAFHCGDICYAFHNIETVPMACEEIVGERIQSEMFGAYVAFAKTGNPNHSQMAHWEPISAQTEATMYFDRTSECRFMADHELMKQLRNSNPLPRPVFPIED